MSEKRLYNLEFEIEVSTIYHDWRRATLEFYSGAVRAVTLSGVIVTLITAFQVISNPWLVKVVVGSSIAVAVVTAIDLAFRPDLRARAHLALYQRFKRLQADIARHRSDADSYMDEWAAEAQETRVDEPSVLWAVYIKAWNQSLTKRNVHPGHLRKITFWQNIFGSFRQFKPGDFKLG